MKFKQLTSLILAGLIFLSPGPLLAATGCSYPSSLDSFADKVANDFLTVANVNTAHCAIEKLETLIGASPTDGGIALGSGTSPFTYMAVLAKGSLVVGDGATDPVALVVGTNGQALVADSTQASGLKWATGTEIVRKTSDETVNNSSTLQDDNDLLYAIAANEVTYFTIQLIYSSSTVADIKTSITVPAGATLRAGPVSGIGFTVSETITFFNALTSSGGAMGNFGGKGAGTERYVTIVGSVRTGGTSGNVTFQWAQAAAEVSDTKVHTDSYIIVWRE